MKKAIWIDDDMGGGSAQPRPLHGECALEMEGEAALSRPHSDAKTQIFTPHRMIGLVTACLALVSGASAAAAEPRCPLIPMGAITGKPDERTVRETLEAFKSVGVDQYLIYARSGLEY